jgi:hypothetical protein
MDNFRAFEDSVHADVIAESDEPIMEAPPEIGVDERRMHVRAYNYWVSLLDGRAYPSVQDLEPENLDDFGPHSVLLDFTSGTDNPAVSFIGRALREECKLDNSIRRISDVPSRSLLSRLTDHYLQIIANCAPIGFEAEFVSQGGKNTMYRGILMPLSSDGDSIDFIYGIINWKEVADGNTLAGLVKEVSRSAAAPSVEASPIWADGPHAEALDGIAFPATGHAIDDTLELGVSYDNEDEDQPSFDLSLDADAGLADRLYVARETAEAVKSADVRSRAALYRALGQAYDFALAAEDAPEDYAEILEDAGLKAQSRAPMTPIVKLIFGVNYDKTRITEFAAALSHGRRQDLPLGGLSDYLERYSGGLKAVVQAERRERRPAEKIDRNDEALAALRVADPIAFLDIDAGDSEFVLLVARREPGGRLAVVAPVAPDRGLIDRAIRKALR